MNVVVDASDSESEDTLVPADAGDVAPELRPDFFCNELLSLFSAEDYVKVVFREGVCHLVSPLRHPTARSARRGPRYGAHHRNTSSSQASRPGLPVMSGLRPSKGVTLHFWAYALGYRYVGPSALFARDHHRSSRLYARENLRGFPEMWWLYRAFGPTEAGNICWLRSVGKRHLSLRPSKVAVLGRKMRFV